ncbi:mucin-19 isoform X4 [Gouania willdenowi]|uniref:mucin-19 isoform X3 n=1 Tax=Gouania willdenowi TaxID=441366 RepID=UPI001054B5FD|nr:mucin-19-like isoform X3 [Gouania willdenowi]XP_028309086.1 mucin-19-like isoform X4 [Gouania willdenowi]
MACTLEKVLGDARTLLERLKEHDTAAEGLIEQSGALSHRVQSMREVANALPDKQSEDHSEIQELSKYKPHILLTQENTQIKELQHENKELWLSLEEHQYTLELIMGRYRKQMLQLMMAKKELDTKPVLSLHEDHAKEVQWQVERICEMGQVMRRAMQVDDQRYCSLRERLAQLEIENKELRDLLIISRSTVKTSRDEDNQPAVTTSAESASSSIDANVSSTTTDAESDAASAMGSADAASPGTGAASPGTGAASLGTVALGGLSPGTGALGGLSPGTGPLGGLSPGKGPLGGLSPVTGPLAGLFPATGPLGGLSPGTGALGGLSPGTGALGGLSPGTGALGGLSPGTGAASVRTIPTTLMINAASTTGALSATDAASTATDAFSLAADAAATGAVEVAGSDLVMEPHQSPLPRSSE